MYILVYRNYKSEKIIENKGGKMRRKMKQKNGITLIALVVTKLVPTA